MKPIKSMYILAAFIGLQSTALLAAKNFRELPFSSNEAVAGTMCKMLIPATPLEATFDDFAETNLSDLNLLALAPVVPKIADFSDGAPVSEISPLILAPVTPKEAVFEDESESGYAAPVQNIAPAAPVVADFEDCV
jgi:hypothetical protein